MDSYSTWVCSCSNQHMHTLSLAALQNVRVLESGAHQQLQLLVDDAKVLERLVVPVAQHVLVDVKVKHFLQTAPVALDLRTRAHDDALK